jgi:hypothetical protein
MVVSLRSSSLLLEERKKLWHSPSGASSVSDPMFRVAPRAFPLWLGVMLPFLPSSTLAQLTCQPSRRGTMQTAKLVHKTERNGIRVVH